ncbi:MAG: hypothetical protein ACXAC2_00395 [Candidatus Kariarchaeaceae archaeon]|jgi:hypothetical protein
MTKATCFACKSDGKETLIDTKQLKDHLWEVHHITRAESGKKITSDVEPISVEVKKYQEHFAPNRFHLMEKNDEGKEERFEVQVPPLFIELERDEKTKLPKIKDKWVMIGFFKNTVIQLEVSDTNVEFIPNDRYTKFSIPMGFHQYCMSCPYGFERSIYNLKDVLKNYPVLKKVKPQELEVLRFRCIAGICEGVQHKFKEKILKFIPAWDEKGEVYENIELFEE